MYIWALWTKFKYLSVLVKIKSCPLLVKMMLGPILLNFARIGQNTSKIHCPIGQNLFICHSRESQIYPTGQNYSLELMFAKFATAKIAKDLNPLKQTSNRL